MLYDSTGAITYLIFDPTDGISLMQYKDGIGTRLKYIPG